MGKKIRGNQAASVPKPSVKRKAPRKAVYIAILSFLVMILFARTTGFEYVNIDDSNLLYSNPTVTDPEIPYSECFRQFVFSAYYKPMVFLTWKIQYDLWGGEAGHFHTVNWILHLINTILVFIIGSVLFRKWFDDSHKRLIASFFLALLFSVNPLRVESVSWVTERKDVLFSFFLLLSWLCYLYYLKTKQYLFMMLGALLYLFSGLSKSMGLPFVAIIFLMDFYFDEKWSFRRALLKIPYYISFILLIVLYGSFNFLIESSAPSLPQSGDAAIDMFVQAENQITSLPYVTSLPEWLQILVTTSARVILWMVHSFIPLNTSIIYSHNQVYGYIGQGIFLYPVILLFLFWYAWKLRRQHGYFLAGLVFYFVTLSPVLAIPESGQAIFMSDRYTYIPSIGLFFSFIVLVTKYFKNAVSQYILLGALSLFFFIESFRIVGNWKNSETLFTRALQVYPESGLAHLNLGLYYRQMKDYDRALQTYSDGKLFDFPIDPNRRPEQRYVFFSPEPPMLFEEKEQDKFNNLFNLTMSYRRDSDIVYSYGDLIPSNKAVVSTRRGKTQKTKLVAWFVSHCLTQSRREAYFERLREYIPVDVYGDCYNNSFKCSYNDTTHLSGDNCYDMIERDYKFYLAFENSLCTDYVTEKFFKILQRRIVPIVIGGADYSKFAPPNSYIDASKYSPRKLAQYLQQLDKDDQLYNEYFKWKESWSVTARYPTVAKRVICELCAKLYNTTETASVYDNLGSLWSITQCKKPKFKGLPLVFGLF